MSNKGKRILITSTDVMMLQFLIPHVFCLQENGYEVEVACSDVENHIDELRSVFEGKVHLHLIDAVRSPRSLRNIRGYRQLRELMAKGQYDLVWTNEPVMGVLTRLAAKRTRRTGGTRVLYFAHGFHFFRGAPKKNWLIFYPIEKLMSRWTDRIITINQEDFSFASAHFRVPVEKYCGIGINTQKFSKVSIDEAAKRESIGVPAEGKLFLSVGELEKRKNHDTAIRAFADAGIDNSYLAICGVGTERAHLEELIREYGLEERVKLLGYRYDIRELLQIADVFVFVTYQEGLSVALMEAMAMEKLCVLSKIRGNVDLVEEENALFCDPGDRTTVRDALCRSVEPLDIGRMTRENAEKLKQFDIEKIKANIIETVRSMTGEPA